MPVSIKNSRRKFTEDSKKLRRARRLYLYLIRDFVRYGNNDVLKYFSNQLLENGLYAKDAPRGMRYKLCRWSFKYTREEPGNAFEWYRWLDKYNFDSNFLKKENQD